MLISINEAQSLVSPEIAGGLVYCSSEAFKAWFIEVSDKARAVCSTTTKANFINDHMISYARQVFEKNNDVEPIKFNGRWQLLIKRKILFKLKKLNNNLRPSSIPTRTAVFYNAQLKSPQYDTQLHFDGIIVPDDIAHVIAGYKENSLKTGMQSYIVCPNGRSNYWVWPLEFTPLSIANDVPTTMLPPDDKQTGLKPKSVTPKNINVENVKEQI